MGAIKDGLRYVRESIEGDINAVSDNPFVVAEDGKILHGGNFHGQYAAIAMDHLKLLLTEMGILAERRLARLLDEKYNLGLPPFLVNGEAGLQSGFMGIQYVPSSLVAENRVLTTPASIMTVSTNANNQDIVSMGTIASRQATEILHNVERIIATELLCEAQAVDLRGKSKVGRGSSCAHRIIRKYVPILTEDRFLSNDIEKVVELIHRREIIDAVERYVGALE